jgi:hypothetical protein
LFVIFSLSIALLHPATRRHFGTISKPTESAAYHNHNQHRKLHLLFPVNEGVGAHSRHLCRALLAAIVHGYEPTIINWNRDGDWHFMQKSKIWGGQL